MFILMECKTCTK